MLHPWKHRKIQLSTPKNSIIYSNVGSLGLAPSETYEFPEPSWKLFFFRDRESFRCICTSSLNTQSTGVIILSAYPNIANKTFAYRIFAEWRSQSLFMTRVGHCYVPICSGCQGSKIRLPPWSSLSNINYDCWRCDRQNLRFSACSGQFKLDEWSLRNCKQMW